MTDYQIQPRSRRCAATGRELQPGEKVFSVLLDAEGRFVRQDYAVEAWQGPPPGAYGFWTGRLPTADGPCRPPINDELLADCFAQLEGRAEPAKVNVRYVLALLLMRRRRLRFEETASEAGREVLVLRCARSGERHRVVNPALAEDELTAVQDDVFRALGWE